MRLTLLLSLVVVHLRCIFVEDRRVSLQSVIHKHQSLVCCAHVVINCACDSWGVCWAMTDSIDDIIVAISYLSFFSKNQRRCLWVRRMISRGLAIPKVFRALLCHGSSVRHLYDLRQVSLIHLIDCCYCWTSMSCRCLVCRSYAWQTHRPSLTFTIFARWVIAL